MRFIPGDDELAQEVIKNYSCLEKPTTKNTTMGNVAEALVQKYYGQPINLAPDKPDDGGDLLVNGAKTDVKNQTNTVNWFGVKTCSGSVACYHGLRAEVYLFVSTDPVSKKIALIGWLTPEEIVKKGTYYRSGDTIPGCPYPCNGDCYRVNISDLGPID